MDAKDAKDEKDNQFNLAIGAALIFARRKGFSRSLLRLLRPSRFRLKF
jgi:hypothetical protein